MLEVHDLAARVVHDLEGGAVGCRPLVAPLTHGGEDRPEVAPLVGEPVLVAQGALLVGHPLEDTGLDQAGQAHVEDVAGDAQA